MNAHVIAFLQGAQGGPTMAQVVSEWRQAIQTAQYNAKHVSSSRNQSRMALEGDLIRRRVLTRLSS
ncbi:hypothetical protein CBOM_07620 [Ceraceosorus bombacis]|uniref:Uncharacterized protein n=1 Tax=Ceraceosorus bombacis TaxID=401625 RepID=A0A0P1BKF1_9BASI|nr:hypothetical protein CBOM_07620 [Ceraceosorus bombacis]